MLPRWFGEVIRRWTIVARVNRERRGVLWLKKIVRVNVGGGRAQSLHFNFLAFNFDLISPLAKSFGSGFICDMLSSVYCGVAVFALAILEWATLLVVFHQPELAMVEALAALLLLTLSSLNRLLWNVFRLRVVLSLLASRVQLTTLCTFAESTLATLVFTVILVVLFVDKDVMVFAKAASLWLSLFLWCKNSALRAKWKRTIKSPNYLYVFT